MSKLLIIWFSFFVLIYLPSFAQSEIKSDTTFVNTSSVKYFLTNPSIKKVQFYTDQTGIRSVSIYPKTIWQATENENYSPGSNYEFFSLGFQGDLYLLEKRYGLINFPEKEIKQLLKKVCDKKFYLRGTITPDSINLQLTYTCVTQPVSPEERVFEKVEIIRSYRGGIKKLKEDMQEIIKINNFSLPENIRDSVLIFTAILNGKDSSILRIELIEGNYSAFSQAMMDAIIKPRSWLPSLQGGRPVKSYFKIFIRLQKDNSIIVDY